MNAARADFSGVKRSEAHINPRNAVKRISITPALYANVIIYADILRHKAILFAREGIKIP